MISVKVHSIFELKKILGQREVELRISGGGTVRDLLGAMVKTWGEELAGRLFAPGTQRLFSYIRVMVNGRDIGFLNGMDTVLQDGDDVLILPPAAGG